MAARDALQNAWELADRAVWWVMRAVLALVIFVVGVCPAIVATSAVLCLVSAAYRSVRAVRFVASCARQGCEGPFLTACA